MALSRRGVFHFVCFQYSPRCELSHRRSGRCVSEKTFGLLQATHKSPEITCSTPAPWNLATMELTIIHTQRPPSTSRFTPVMNSASSLPRYAHAFATSFGVELRPSGIVAMKGFSFSFLPRNRSVLKRVSSKAWNGIGQLTSQYPKQRLGRRN